MEEKEQQTESDRGNRAAVVAHQAAEFDALEAVGDRAQLRDLRAHGLG